MNMLRPFLFLLFAGIIAASVSENLHAADSFVSKINSNAKTFRQNTEQIAGWCYAHHLQDEAAFAKSALIPEYPDRICIPQFPLKQGMLTIEKNVPKNLPADYTAYLTGKTNVPPDSKYTDKQLAHNYIISLREEYAKDLSGYARTACKQGRGTLAVQLAMAALHANPDDIKLRAAFGFVKYKDEWRSPWEVKKLKDGFIDHQEFGWIPEKYVKQYEAGQRYYNGKWISADEDAKVHSTVENGWIIESEFYLLATNHSIEGGVRLRRKLEHFYRAWKMFFYRYFATDEQLAGYFSGGITPQIPVYRHKMIVYRDKDEFMRETNRSETTGGFYRPAKKCCFFFFSGNPQNAPYGTMFHEGTHQLFAEVDPKTKSGKGGGNNFNYWIIEGVADFMGTFQMLEHFYTIGSSNNTRGAAQLWKNEGKAMPLAEMLEFNGTRKWTTEPYEDIGSLYTQAKSMFQYLMFADNGGLRDELIVYLWQVYNGKDTANTFQQLFKMSLDEFDRKYKQFLEE